MLVKNRQFDPAPPLFGAGGISVRFMASENQEFLGYRMTLFA